MCILEQETSKSISTKSKDMSNNINLLSLNLILCSQAKISTRASGIVNEKVLRKLRRVLCKIILRNDDNMLFMHVII